MPIRWKLAVHSTDFGTLGSVVYTLLMCTIWAERGPRGGGGALVLAGAVRGRGSITAQLTTKQ